MRRRRVDGASSSGNCSKKHGTETWAVQNDNISDRPQKEFQLLPPPCLVVLGRKTGEQMTLPPPVVNEHSARFVVYLFNTQLNFQKVRPKLCYRLEFDI